MFSGQPHSVSRKTKTADAVAVFDRKRQDISHRPKFQVSTCAQCLIQVSYICPFYRKLLRILIDNLNLKETQTELIVLQIFTEIFKNKDMKQCWSNFVELLTLRILDAICDEKKEVNFLIIASTFL